MKTYKTITLLASALMASVACANLKIVTTTQDLGAIAKAIGGDKVSVFSIVTGTRDPHKIEAKPSFMSKVAGANMFVAVGLELEIAYEKAILDGSRNRNVAIGAKGHVYASDFAYILEKPAGAVSRAQGDVHPYGNPHIWLDPYNGRQVAIGLAGKMAELDPGNADAYKANMRKFVNALDAGMFGQALFAKYGGPKLWDWQRAGQLDDKLKAEGTLGQLGGWAGQMMPHAGTPIITYHRTWSYLARRFGLNVVEELEPKPGLEPTPGHLAAVTKLGMQQKVKVILQEPYYSPRHAQFVGSRINAQVLVLPNNVGQAPGADDYISFMDQVVDKLSGALK